MRKIIVFAVLGATAVSAWLMCSRITKARRETAYHAAIAPFQRDLTMGTPRADVKKYLDARNIDYHVVRVGGSEADTYEIKIGEEPGSLVCEPWNVYVALDFSSEDTLRDIHIRRVGTCL